MHRHTHTHTGSSSTVVSTSQVRGWGRCVPDSLDRKWKALDSQSGPWAPSLNHQLKQIEDDIGLYVYSFLCPRHLREKAMAPTPVLSPGKSHGQRSLVGHSPWGRKESDTTEWLHFHFSLSCIGEGNSNPLQCSCLENPRDRGAWCAAIYGVAQSQTRLKRLSSSSSSSSSIQ